MSSEQSLRVEATHLLAESFTLLCPGVVLGTGGAAGGGFHFDATLPGPTPGDLLAELNGMLRKLAAEGPAPTVTVTPQEAADLLAAQPLQLALLRELAPAPTVRVRCCGDHTLLEAAAGGASDEPAPVPAGVELTAVSGAYWRGSSDNTMLTRVSGYAFATEAELAAQLDELADARARDHRKLGRELRLFATSEEIGAGLPLWLPRGTVIRRELENWITEQERVAGYQHVVTPQLARRALYERSGHWDHYKDDMFPVMRVGEEELVLRPMNCPHHITVFKSGANSYRALPVRLAELGTMYRSERSGVVGGLNRVRAMTLNDAHIFCTPEQVGQEFARTLELVERCYRTLGITNHRYRLSLRDKASQKYVGGDDMWQHAADIIRRCLDDLGLPYREATGEAAFYGPKLDIQLPDLMGREETLSTIQVDFHLAERFGLEYVGPDGSGHRPVIIDRGVLSTMERMVAHLIELYGGAFPVWLAPVQVVVLPVAEHQQAWAATWAEELVRAGYRAEVAGTADTLGARIRSSRNDKIPFVAVVGEREVADGTVSIRARTSRRSVTLPRDAFVDRLRALVRTRSREMNLAEGVS